MKVPTITLNDKEFPYQKKIAIKYLKEGGRDVLYRGVLLYRWFFKITNEDLK